METYAIFVVALFVALFGFFWGYERQGPWWSAVAMLLSMFAAAGVSAIAEADATSVGKQFVFNIVVFSSATLGYTIGYPYKRTWWKQLVITIGLIILIFGVYYTTLV